MTIFWNHRQELHATNTRGKSHLPECHTVEEGAADEDVFPDLKGAAAGVGVFNGVPLERMISGLGFLLSCSFFLFLFLSFVF